MAILLLLGLTPALPAGEAPGRVTPGVQTVNGQYIVNYDEAIRKLPPPGATWLKAERAMYAD